MVLKSFQRESEFPDVTQMLVKCVNSITRKVNKVNHKFKIYYICFKFKSSDSEINVAFLFIIDRMNG